MIAPAPTDMILRGALVWTPRAPAAVRDLAVAGGRIAAEAGGEEIDCRRRMIVPGLVNAHFHSNENWFKGRFDRLPLEPWMLYSYPALLAPVQGPAEIELRTLLGCVELLRGGTTTVVDFLYELAGMTLETLEAVVGAYRRAGLRALVVLGIADLQWRETVVLDTEALSASARAALDAEAPPPWPAWRELAEEAVRRFHRPEEGIAIALGPSGPQRCSDAMLAGCTELAHEHGLLVHTHVLETRMQARAGRDRWGTTLPRALDALGCLDDRTCFEHAIWLADEDLPLLAERGVRVVHNPVSNLKLGSGACRVRELRAHAIPVGLGTDGASSNDGTDMLATVKTAALIHFDPREDFSHWLGAEPALEMATAGGAAATPWDVGRLEEGAPADLLALDLDHHSFTPLNEPARQLAYTAPSGALRDVMIGGRWVLRDGSPTGFDADAVLAEARDVGRAIVARFAAADALAGDLLAGVRAGWLQVAGGSH